MARFRYRMQSLLDIKLKLEDSAKQFFAEKKIALDREEEALFRLKDRKRTYEEEAVELRKGILDFLKLSQNRDAIRTMDDLIDNQNARVREAQRELEKAREAMTQAVMERKAQETLREKAFEQFLEDEKKNESKEVDELTSYTYGKRKAE